MSHAQRGNERRTCAAPDCNEPVTGKRSDAVFHDDTCRLRTWRLLHDISVPSRFQAGQRADLGTEAQRFWAGVARIRRGDLRQRWPREGR